LPDWIADSNPERLLSNVSVISALELLVLVFVAEREDV